jgi:Domain of unknown function (DUF1844)
MTDERSKVGAEAVSSKTDKVAEEPGVPIDFATFILSLSSSSAIHLGLVPHPENEKIETNLPMAKQTIDIIDILQEKTKGNLTEDEERLLGEILYNMRMAFVRATSQAE